MKIKVIHDECGREVLTQQIRESGGHCPWDGKAFTRDYTATLTEALGIAENAGSVLQTGLEQIAGMKPALTIVRDSVIEPLEVQVERLAEGKRRRSGDDRGHPNAPRPEYETPESRTTSR